MFKVRDSEWDSLKIPEVVVQLLSYSSVGHLLVSQVSNHFYPAIERIDKLTQEGIVELGIIVCTAIQHIGQVFPAVGNVKHGIESLSRLIGLLYNTWLPQEFLEGFPVLVGSLKVPFEQGPFYWLEAYLFQVLPTVLLVTTLLEVCHKLLLLHFSFRNGLYILKFGLLSSKTNIIIISEKQKLTFIFHFCCPWSPISFGLLMYRSASGSQLRWCVIQMSKSSSHFPHV